MADPTPYLNAADQRRRLLTLSATDRLDHMRVLAAWQRVASTADGQTVLDDMVQKVLLQPCLTERDEGKRLLVLDILRLVRQAGERLRTLRAQEER